jgi:hypothetical protein
MSEVVWQQTRRMRSAPFPLAVFSPFGTRPVGQASFPSFRGVMFGAYRPYVPLLRPLNASRVLVR